MKPIFKQYDNGLRLIFKKVEANRPACLFFEVDVGSCKEDENNNGISHFIEHLNFKGTNKRDAKQICTQLEEMGINANAFTTKTSTCFHGSCLNEKFEDCFEIFSDMLFNSKYDEDDIKRERRVIYEEIDMYEDDAETVAYEDFSKSFYAGTVLQKSIIGTKQSLENIKRDDIVNFVKAHYVPQNIVVSVVGNFNLSYVEKLVNKYINKKFTQKGEIEKKLKAIVVIPDKKFNFIKKEIQQTQVVMGFPCENIYSENKMLYSLMCFIFGGGMGSRLFQKVREEHGLVYSISCMPELFEIGGNISISFGTNANSEAKAIELIKEEIDKVLLDGFTQAELNRAKVFCKSLIISGFETTSSMAKANASNIRIFNKIIPVEEKLQEIDAVTLENLNEIAKKIFNYTNICGSSVSSKPNEKLFDLFG